MWFSADIVIGGAFLTPGRKPLSGGSAWNRAGADHPISDENEPTSHPLRIGTSRSGLRAVEFVRCHARAGTLSCRFHGRYDRRLSVSACWFCGADVITSRVGAGLSRWPLAVVLFVNVQVRSPAQAGSLASGSLLMNPVS
jgi:hypothetical protein